MEWQDAIGWDDLDAGSPRLVRIGTTHVLVIRDGTTAFATEPLCPHKFTALEEGHLADGCLVCPTHDAHFQLPDGTPRPGDEWAGSLATYPCRVRSGRIQVLF